MPALSFDPTLSFYSALSAVPLRPLHALMRAAGDRGRPAQPVAHRPLMRGCQEAALSASPVLQAARAVIAHERGYGGNPTVVFGGLVPDALEQVFLLRHFLLRSGDVYYVQYPRTCFALDMIHAQLDDLLEELNRAGEVPVLFAVSFGAGVVLDWLRRRREAGRPTRIGGLVLVSPVTCVADLIAPNASKPSTLLGRALKPFLDPAPASDTTVERSRALFLRMFEAGAQNKFALRMLMTPAEVERLRTAVQNTIRGVSSEGARQRVQALRRMLPPTEYFQPHLLPLSDAPTLVLFAECEDAVLDAAAPARFALERATTAYFPQARCLSVKAARGQAPVQHASLVFHVFDFLPPLRAFYQQLRRMPLPFAA